MLQIPAGGWIYVWMRVCIQAKQRGGFGYHNFKIALDLNAWVISLAISQSAVAPDQDTEDDVLENRWYGIINPNHSWF